MPLKYSTHYRHAQVEFMAIEGRLWYATIQNLAVKH